MHRELTVTAYHGAGESFGHDKEWGPLVPHRFEAEGVPEAITWNRKPNAEAPRVGEVLQGELEHTAYGYKFKKARQNNFTGGGGRSPEERKSIVRQHSQHMSLLYMQAKGITEFKLDEDFRKVVDWFDRDAGV